MGNYITTTDVQKRLRRNYETIYTRDGAVDTDLVDADIDAAEGLVDSYLAGRYTVPVTDAEALRAVKAWALTLLEEIAYGSIPGRELPKSVSTRADAVRKQLDAVADGSRSLGSDTPADERDNATSTMIVEGETPVMGRTNLSGF